MLAGRAVGAATRVAAQSPPTALFGSSTVPLGPLAVVLVAVLKCVRVTRPRVVVLALLCDRGVRVGGRGGGGSGRRVVGRAFGSRARPAPGSGRRGRACDRRRR